MSKATAGNPRNLEVRNLWAKYKALESRARSFLFGLNTAQENTILNTLSNWTGATANQKADALLACVAMLFVVVGYLVRLQIKDQP